MQTFVKGIFDFLAVLFDKIPFLTKFKGYRAVIGYVGLAVTTTLTLKGVLSTEQALPIIAGFEMFKDLALNAKGRE